MWRDNVEEACSVLRAGAYSSDLEALGLHRWFRKLSVSIVVTIYSLMWGSLVLVKAKIVV